MISLGDAFPNPILAFDSDELADDPERRGICGLHLARRLSRGELLFDRFDRQRRAFLRPREYCPLARYVERHAFRQPAWRLATSERVNDYMYEFVAERCFQNSSFLQNR